MKKRVLRLLCTLMIATVLFTMINGNASVNAASSYYVDSNASNASDSGPGSIAQPWKTLEAVSSRTFSPGDTIYFACGSSYSGTCSISSSGTSGNHIFLTSYGSGNKPSFSNPGGLYIFQITGDYLEIDGLKLNNSTTMSTWNDTTYCDSGSILIRQGADNVTVKNCEITNVGVGIKSYGLYTSITNNNFHDLVIGYTDSEQSYGALGVSINNSNATIAYNTFTNCRSTSSPYGADGGAIEIEGWVNNKDNISIHHNKSTGCQGFIEVTETQSSNVTISYNISDDYQQFLAWDTTNTPYNFKVENNTIVRTHTSNVTAVFTVLYYREEGPSPSSSWMSFKNNVFYTPACKVLNGSYSYKYYNYPHSYNLFYDGSANPVGYALGTGDMIANPQFVNFNSRDLHLSSSSPAINAGTNLGYSSDFEGNPVPNESVPDMGAYEYQGIAPTPTPTPTPGSGGALSAACAVQSATVNLSSEGTVDWCHWGLNAAGDFDHKSGVTQQISNYTQIGSGTVSRYDNNPAGYTWTGGTPHASATNTKTGIYLVGIGNGFQLTVPADTTSKTIKLYCGLYKATGKFEASLSDNSAAAYTDMSVSNSTGSTSAVYSINFKAGSAGQTLTLKWTVDQVFDASWGNVTIQAASFTQQ